MNPYQFERLATDRIDEWLRRAERRRLAAEARRSPHATPMQRAARLLRRLVAPTAAPTAACCA